MNTVPQHRVRLPEGDTVLEKAEDGLVGFEERPVQPVQLIVVTVGVVVALLGASHLIAHEDHRYALTEHENRYGVLDLFEP